MASSMTGLGIGEIQKDGFLVTVELRSVNNRFIEISCRMPSFLSNYEREFRGLIKKKIHRGKLYATISIQEENDSILNIHVDPKMARAVHHLLDDLRRATGVDEKLRLEHFLKFSEIFEAQKEKEGSEKTWGVVKEALAKALTNLKKMRDQEGEELARDIVTRIQKLEEAVDSIEQITQKNLPDAYEKMVKRIRILVKDSEVNEGRLNTEIAVMADKMDVTEECVRLRSHHRLFRSILEDENVVGKKFNFLLQEMNREANTISNKATNVEISHLIVEMKEEIERLREQIQNLE